MAGSCCAYLLKLLSMKSSHAIKIAVLGATMSSLLAISKMTAEQKRVMDYLHQSEAEISLSNSDAMQKQSSSSSSSAAKKPFNPFEDMRFHNVTKNAVTSNNMSRTSLYYSSYHCVATGLTTNGAARQTDVGSNEAGSPNYRNRSCRYRNLYYQPSDQTWHYLASPVESRARHKILGFTEAWGKKNQGSPIPKGLGDNIEMLTRMQVSLGPSAEINVERMLQRQQILPWMPEWHETLENDHDGRTTNATFSSFSSSWLDKHTIASVDAVFLLYQPFYGDNIGHFVWDDLLSLFSLLDLFNLEDKAFGQIQPVPFFVENAMWKNGVRVQGHGGRDIQYRCSPWNSMRWKSCIKTYHKFFPKLVGIQTDCMGDILRTGNWLQGPPTWMGNSNSINEIDPKCFQQRGRLVNQAPADLIRIPRALVGTGRLNNYGCEQDCALGRGPQFWRFRTYLWRHLFNGVAPNEEEPPTGFITFSLPIGSSRSDEVYHFEPEIQWARATYGDKATKVVDMASLTMPQQAKLMSHTAVLLTNHGGGSVTSMFLPRHAAAIVYWHRDVRYDHPYYESQGYFRTVWVGVAERFYVNRTVSILAMEVEKTAHEWPSILQLYKNGSVDAS